MKPRFKIDRTPPGVGISVYLSAEVLSLLNDMAKSAKANRSQVITQLIKNYEVQRDEA